MRTFLAAALISIAVPAAADPAPPGKAADVGAMHEGDCARARKQNKTCVLDMGKGDDIDGNAPTAGGSAIGIATFTKATSLIRIRRDFIVEILKTAEDL